jgi:hypothetical protein
MAAAKISGKVKTTVYSITSNSQQQGCIVLNWDCYQKLLDEISELIGKDD